MTTRHIVAVGVMLCIMVTATSAHARHHKKPTRTVHISHIDADQIIGGRPAGCPHRYCGCGLRKYLGISDTRLNLAWNWARLFPREHSPRPGLAAVRKGHVMYIEASAGNGQFLIRDYNSGRGLSRLHVRDVRGYVFVNPHGSGTYTVMPAHGFPGGRKELGAAS